MAQILVRGEILLNEGQVQALLTEANRIYESDWSRFSGHGISQLMPLTLDKLKEVYRADHWKLYLDGWLIGLRLPQVCFIPKPWHLEDGNVYYCISMDDGWVEEVKDRAISALADIFNAL